MECGTLHVHGQSLGKGGSVGNIKARPVGVFPRGDLWRICMGGDGTYVDRRRVGAGPDLDQRGRY